MGTFAIPQQYFIQDNISSFQILDQEHNLFEDGFHEWVIFYGTSNTHTSVLDSTSNFRLALLLLSLGQLFLASLRAAQVEGLPAFTSQPLNKCRNNNKLHVNVPRL